MFWKKLFGKSKMDDMSRQEFAQSRQPIESAGSCPDEEREYDRDFRQYLSKLEYTVHSSESTSEIMMESLKTACEFYDAEFSGILIADIGEESWAPVVCYNRWTGNHVSRYTKEIESFDGFGRWVEAFGASTPIVVPDTSIIKAMFPDEYEHYERLKVDSLIGAPFGEKPTGFFVIKNPRRYKTMPDMARMLAFVGMSTYYLQELQQSEELYGGQAADDKDKDLVYINILGSPEVCVGSKRIDMRKYSSMKSWMVIVYLALKKKAVSGRTIVSDLWPNVDTTKAMDNLRSTCYQMRGKFQFLCPEFVVSENGGYWFNRDKVIVLDTEMFEMYLKKAKKEKNHTLKLDALKRAVSLYRGHLFDEQCDDSWISNYHYHYSKLYAECITALLDELGLEENYSEIHKFVVESLSISHGIIKVYFWLIVSTEFISGHAEAVKAAALAKADLTEGEYKELIRISGKYITKHKG